jgi:hypothetical protein
MVMKEQGGDGWGNRDRRLEDSLRITLSDPAKLHSSCIGRQNKLLVDGHLCAVCRYPLSVILPEGKLDLIFRMMRVMTDHYRVPYLFPTWSKRMAEREALGSTGCGYGFGLLHQFQDDGIVGLDNYPVDWWMVIFPEGVDWDAYDDKPVYGMIGHVFPHLMPCFALGVYEKTHRAVWEMKVAGITWERLAKVDRVTAARVVNQAVARVPGVK